MSNEIITIATYTYSRALLIQAQLNSVGIESFLGHENMLQSNISGGVDILIRKEDADKAYKIIKKAELNYGQSKESALNKLKEIRRILVPVDFREPSVNACQYAVAMGKVLKAEVKLLHVYFNPAINTEPLDGNFSYQLNMEKYTREIESSARNNLRQLSQTLKEQLARENEKSVNITISLLNGRAEDGIIEMSNSYKPGVIVLGSRTKKGKPGLWFGSNTERIIQHTNVPVLVVPERTIFLGTSFLKHILFITRFEEADKQAVLKLISLVRPFGMTIHCIHLNEDHDTTLDRERMEELKKYFGQFYTADKLICGFLKAEDPVMEIKEYISQNDIDIISLTTHPRNIIEKWIAPSLATQILFDSERPMLIFKL